jgi:hypothetical protein
MRILLGLVLSVFGFFVASTAMAAALAIHIGEYYVGPGQAATVAFRPLPGGKATIAAVETLMTSKMLKPVTKAMVIQSLKSGYTGTLKKVSPGHYDFILGSPSKPDSYCIHTVTVKPEGLFIQQPKIQNGCAYYHGASWSFSAPIPSPLKPYKVGK